MSRNLGDRMCRFCHGDVICVEPQRAITAADTGAHYFKDYDGMKVANAECRDCCGKYLAWLTVPSRWGQDARYTQIDEDGAPIIRDLSFRSSFNDEPGEDDLPHYEIVVKRDRVPIRPDNHWHEFYGKKVLA